MPAMPVSAQETSGNRYEVFILRARFKLFVFLQWPAPRFSSTFYRYEATSLIRPVQLHVRLVPAGPQVFLGLGKSRGGERFVRLLLCVGQPGYHAAGLELY